MIYSLYRVLTEQGAPLIRAYLRHRLAEGREDPERFAERMGAPSRPRTEGPLVWCHAASVGEAASLLLLIKKIHDLHPDISVLVTTGTVTAAAMVGPRLPPYALHQYVPVDVPQWVENFLDHWKPSLALWTESELWPNTLAALRDRNIPTVLLNARMSEKSFRNWYRVKGFAQELLSTFSLCLAQTESDRSRYVALGAAPVKNLGNLKYASEPLPFDANELKGLRDQILGRPAWLMASTHKGEEEMAVAAHLELSETRMGLLTILAPRHPVRADEIAQMIASKGLKVARRSKNEKIALDTDVYLADTMGEMGLFYALSPLVVLGGSFVPTGGHNPIEPAQFGAAIAFGPWMFNFSEITREFLASEAAIQLHHANELPFTVDRLLKEPQERDRLGSAARLLAEQKRSILDHILVELEPWLRS